MNITLPTQYVINKFYQYSSHVKYHKSSNSYRGSCPICKEGNSLGQKTRLNYYTDDNVIVCYNCQKSWGTLYWVKEVTGKSLKDILKESQEYDHFSTVDYDDLLEEPKTKNTQTLPFDSINLSDPIQTRYYSDNYVVKHALNYIKERRLDTAINKCTFYVSLKDYLHKNRLVIPFVDPDNKIRFYQSRALYKENEDMGKYLSKLNADKSIFGLNTIDEKLDYVFIFEGPIDSMFVKNGISMAGLKISEHQKELLNTYFLFKRIWVLDNQLDNIDVKNKMSQLIDDGEQVFIWPKNYSKFKDVNEICCNLKIDSINPEFFIKNSYSGPNAKARISFRV